MNLERIRRELLDRGDQLQRRLDRIRRDRRRSDAPLSPDFEEQAVQRENDETLDRLDTRTRAELTAVDRAIARLDAGRYGVCEACGDAIGEERLGLLLATSRCAACARDSADVA